MGHIGRALPMSAAIAGAVYLIANGYEHGWGWLLLIAALAIP